MKTLLIDPDVLVILEDKCKGKCLQESCVNIQSTLLVERLYILRELWLLLLRSFDIVKEVFVQEVQSTTRRLIDFE